MGFTTPCFIRKNTERLRESLKRLGIRPLLSNERLNAIGDNIKVYHGREAVFSCSYSQELYGHFLDCGTNESLFLAIAALRDDTDNNQMFINGKGDWGICRDNTEYGGLALDVLSHYLRPFQDVLDCYTPLNDSVEEFTQRLKGMGYDGPFEYREEEI